MVIAIHQPASARPPPQARTRVIVAHAAAGARRRLRDVLAGSPDIVVVADARDGVEALELSRFYRPEVILVDAGLPRRGGVATVTEIVAVVATAAIVVSIDGEDLQTGVAALRHGAAGFVADLAAIPDAVRTVARGGATISPRLAMHLVESLRYAGETGLRPVRSALTAREWEVLDLLCANRSTRQIAGALHLTDDTVYGHIKRILRKLGVRSRAEAVDAAGVLRATAR